MSLEPCLAGGQRRLPRLQIGFEVGTIAVLVGVRQLVKGAVLGVQKGAIPLEEVVVDDLSHCQLGPPGRVVGWFG